MGASAGTARVNELRRLGWLVTVVGVAPNGNWAIAAECQRGAVSVPPDAPAVDGSGKASPGKSVEVP